MRTIYTIPNWELPYLNEGWLLGTPEGAFRILGNNGIGLVIEPVDLADSKPTPCPNCINHLKKSFEAQPIDFKDYGKDI